ncbi:DUF2909 domain-containing protein [Comamonas piscis]|nr:DUF2909 domain-containing protein [Comamonas piscis]WSO35420.1 DUF2909 domain-containing protein [Comamonas piscis]
MVPWWVLPHNGSKHRAAAVRTASPDTPLIKITEDSTMHLLIAFAFVVILACLAAAGLFMLRGNQSEAGGKRMAWALTLRIAISVLVFAGILLAWKLGYLQPHGIPLGA